MVVILSDNYRLPLPIGSFIVLTYPGHLPHTAVE